MDLKNFVNGLTIADKIYLYNTLYKDLACEGIDGDTELAHVNVQEMSVLRAMGGSGTINPNTNLLQFGGGGSPPPPPPATQTVTQQATIPDELKPFITDILEKSKAIQERREEEGYVPFQGPRLADFTEEQQTAFEGIEGLQGAGQPFFDRSTALTEASAQAPTAQSVSDFSNPFIQNVIDIQKREAQRLGDVERQQIGAQAVQAGGFGGSRHAILEAEQSRNLQQQLGDIQSRGSAAAFEDAQARLQQQRERERQAGAQFAGLGSQVPGQRLREITGLEAVGAQKQSLGQAGIDIAAQEFEIGRSFPERTLQDYQSIVRGYAQPIPASTLQRASSQQPAPSFLSQAAGLGAAGIGAFKAFGGNAQGGLVGLAEGGLPAGGTALESSTEAISTRAQNDPLTQVERQPLSQGQQFVRGQENQEAATVEDQLQQIQGLALGATNAIAQGQQKLASMNTAPGMGAQPANFGGNVGSFGFKKGGLLGLKHLANGGTVRLANGSQPKSLLDFTDQELSDPRLLGSNTYSIGDILGERRRRVKRTSPSPILPDQLKMNEASGLIGTKLGEALKQRRAEAAGESDIDTSRGSSAPLLNMDMLARGRIPIKHLPSGSEMRATGVPMSSHMSKLTEQESRSAVKRDPSIIKKTPLQELVEKRKNIANQGIEMDIESVQKEQTLNEAFPKSEQIAFGGDTEKFKASVNPSEGMRDIGTGAKDPLSVAGIKDVEEGKLLGPGDAPQLPGVPDMEQSGLESIDEIMKEGAAKSPLSENEAIVKQSITADVDGGGIAGEVESLTTTKVEFISEVDRMRNSPEYLKMTEINERLKEATGKERELLQKQLDEGGEVEKGYALMDLGFGILAQPGGQTFLQAIGKGAKDSKFTSKLAKLSDKQKKLSLDFAKLDRRELQDELGLSKQQATMVMEGRKLDIQSRVANAQLRNATTKAQAAAAKANVAKLNSQIKLMDHRLSGRGYKIDTEAQINMAKDAMKNVLNLDNLSDANKKILSNKGYEVSKGLIFNSSGEDVLENMSTLRSWTGSFNTAIGKNKNPYEAEQTATNDFLRSLPSLTKKANKKDNK